jgi:hypothetical protein
VRGDVGGAGIPFGGQEMIVTNEVLRNPGNWVAANGGTMPDGAVVFGREADGTPLYVARANVEGGVHPGKVRPEGRAAMIPSVVEKLE